MSDDELISGFTGRHSIRHEDSWDDLHYAIDKILLWEVYFNTQSKEAKRAAQVTMLPICAEKSDVFREVRDFVKWYNQYKNDNR